MTTQPPPEQSRPKTTILDLTQRLEAEEVLWSTAELEARGIWHGERRRLVQSRVLVQIQRGAYARRSHADGLRRSERAELRLHAHAKVYSTRRNRGFVYSHTSAARIHGCQLWHADEFVHVTCRSRTSPGRLCPATVMHHLSVAPDETDGTGFVEFTTLERTVVDCCRILDLEGSLVIMDQALRLGADRKLVERYAERLHGQRGVVNLRSVLELADPKSESMGETRTRFMLWLLNMSMPVSQYEVMTDRGLRRLDFAWPDLMVALEFDGKIKYFGETPTDDAIAEERIRERRLMEMGWIFVRIDWKDLDNPVGVKRWIHAAWASARSRSRS
ncbi:MULTISPECIES: hypothetical protein [Arthrobacter]|uniref:Transcriptional regulator, AbiEi antitoxin, Type IV TA system n=2 Tax=Arthrobacter TaxID=1663 RepID=A0ABU9KNL0_9MICC|nr:hypothetical protein [Arthrobacter sp. YJM1]MDP5228487.1 hypothetical protein [Arthrobacter sp. YJM1]